MHSKKNLRKFSIFVYDFSQTNVRYTRVYGQFSSAIEKCLYVYGTFKSMKEKPYFSMEYLRLFFTLRLFTVSSDIPKENIIFQRF